MDNKRNKCISCNTLIDINNFSNRYNYEIYLEASLCQTCQEYFDDYEEEF